MPTGRVKWYDAEKGFGFVTNDEGGDVYLPSSALPAGVASLKPGTRVEFGIAAGRRGDAALGVRVLDPLPSVAASHRKEAEDMAAIVEDLIKVLDRVGGTLRRGRYPQGAEAQRVAALLRAVADDLDA